MKLIQKKQFNSITITNDIAAQICAIGGLWKHYNEEKYKSQGFIIEDEWYGASESGSSSTHSVDWKNPEYTKEGFVRTHAGVTITPKCGTSHVIRLWSDGKLSCANVHNKGDWKSFSSDKGLEEYDSYVRTLEYPCNQIKLVQLYIDLAFYGVGV